MVLSNMFLVETERGCSRRCTYCVMRRSTNGGMRLVPMERILELVPEDARRVGLVGAAVSDHPKDRPLINALADRGCEVGLSSLRPDRLNDDFVAALRRGGQGVLTTAMDGPSEKMRELLERKAKEKHLIRCAELTRRHGMDRLKLYLMIGLPGESDDDIDECVRFTTELNEDRARRPRDRAVLREAEHAARRPGVRRDRRRRSATRSAAPRTPRAGGRPLDEREVGVGRVRPRAGRSCRRARDARGLARRRQLRRLTVARSRSSAWATARRPRPADRAGAASRSLRCDSSQLRSAGTDALAASCQTHARCGGHATTRCGRGRASSRPPRRSDYLGRPTALFRPSCLAR